MPEMKPEEIERYLADLFGKPVEVLRLATLGSTLPIPKSKATGMELPCAWIIESRAPNRRVSYFTPSLQAPLAMNTWQTGLKN